MNSALKTSLWLAISALALAGCKKDDDDAATPETPTPAATVYSISSVPVFTAKVDGTPVTFKQGTDGVTTSTNVYNANNVALFGVNYKMGSNTKAIVSIGGLAVNGSTPPSDQAFTNFFTTGSKSYSGVMSYNGVGIVMYYNNLPYDSGFVPSQAGSTFVVTDVQPVNDGSGIAKMKVRATFNCKISTGSSTKTLTEGQFVGIFQKLP
ncbi:MAG TPA: hypothetical protein PLZ25_13405 [Flavobacteriales bacterium]|nr:hypothetical protein [Flavobacteriales bacterium]